MTLFELVAKIVVDSTGFDNGIEESEKKASSFGGKLKAGLGGAAKAGAVALGVTTAAATALTKSVVDGTGEVASYGDNIDKMSQKMGISAEAYQEWDAIMQHSGTTIESLKPSMKTLANAAEKGSDAFEKLGISQKEVANLSQEDLFARVISGLQSMEEGTERTYITSQLLGRGATELGALLNTSAEETEEMRKQVHELGGVMSNEAVKASAKYQDTLQDMQTAIEGTKRGIMSNFLPSVTSVMEGLTDIFSGNQDSGIGKINQGVSDFVGKLTENIPKVLDSGMKIFNGLLSAITSNIPQLISAGTQAVILFANGLINNFPSILNAGVQAIVTLANGLSEALPELIPAAVEAVITLVNGLLNNLPMLIEAAAKLIIGISVGLIQALPKLIVKIPEIIVAIVKAIVGGVKELVKAGGELALGLAKGILDMLMKPVEAIKNVGMKILNAIKNFFGIHSPSTVFSDIGKNLIQGLIDGIGNMLNAAIEKVRSIGKSIYNAVTGFFGIGEGKNAFESIGENLMSGLGNGISNAASAVVNKAKSVASRISGAVKGFFGIASPSKLMAKYGDFVMEGLGVGIQRSAIIPVKEAIKASKNISQSIRDAANKQMSDFSLFGGVSQVDLSDYATVWTKTASNSSGSRSSANAVLQAVNSAGKSNTPVNVTLILELDRMQTAKAVYKLNSEETARIGLKLAGGVA